MSRFSGCYRGVDRFKVAHFSHQNNVGIFTKRRAQRLREAFHINVYLALCDHGLFMIVNVLDRILDSDYVTVSLTVDIIDHCGQRGGFSRTGRPRYQNHSSRSQRKFSQKRGKSQILQSGNLVKKKAHSYRVISALTVNVDSVPLPRRGNKGKVCVQPLLNDLFMLYRSNLVDNVYYKRLGHIGVLGEFFYIAVYSDYRGQTHREMYVRRFYRPCLIENFVDIQCHCLGFLSKILYGIRSLYKLVKRRLPIQHHIRHVFPQKLGAVFSCEVGYLFLIGVFGDQLLQVVARHYYFVNGGTSVIARASALAAAA